MLVSTFLQNGGENRMIYRLCFLYRRVYDRLDCIKSCTCGHLLQSFIVDFLSSTMVF